MNWYRVFYWITIADGVKSFFDVFSDIFTTFSIVFFFAWIVLIFLGRNEDGSKWDTDDLKALNYWRKMLRSSWTVCFIFMMITWTGYVFCPSKKDALVIVAGGAVGNFITKDSSAKQIPSEVMTLLRDKIRSEIKDVHIADAAKDTLESMTKEELIKLIKGKKSD